MFKKRIPAVFFVNETGSAPVRNWIRSLDKSDRVRIGHDIGDVEYGWPVGMPVCRPLGQGLYEVRTNLKDRIARVMFGIVDGEMVLLHGFIKRTQTTPAADLALARQRLKAYMT